MKEKDEAIGLLGGSFDPVHNGHLSIARSFVHSPYISRLWILLTPDPPHKREQPLSSYTLRLRMLKEAFSGWSRVKVSDLEKKLPSPSYTVQTVEYLREQYPAKTFYLCVGEDSARNFTEWYQWEGILEQCELLVARRNTTDDLKLDARIEKKAHIIPHDTVDISSTEIRKKIAAGQKYSDLVPESVAALIEEYQLYQK